MDGCIYVSMYLCIYVVIGCVHCMLTSLCYRLRVFFSAVLRFFCRRRVLFFFHFQRNIERASRVCYDVALLLLCLSLWSGFLCLLALLLYVVDWLVRCLSFVYCSVVSFVCASRGRPARRGGALSAGRRRNSPSAREGGPKRGIPREGCLSQMP